MSSTADTTSSQQDLWMRALDTMPGGISHPNRRKNGDPVYIRRAKGSRMWDVEGNEYIDYSMGSASLLLGHAHPDVVKAIQEQAPHGTYTASCHALEVEWAGMVQELMPSAERVRFVASGSESTLLAARVARAYTGRAKIVRFQNHYNGWSDFTITGSEAPYDEAPGAGVVPGAAESIIVLPTDPAKVEETLKSNDDIAARHARSLRRELGIGSPAGQFPSGDSGSDGQVWRRSHLRRSDHGVPVESGRRSGSHRHRSRHDLHGQDRHRRESGRCPRRQGRYHGGAQSAHDHPRRTQGRPQGHVQRRAPRRRAGRRHAQDRQDGRAAQARRCHRREDTPRVSAPSSRSARFRARHTASRRPFTSISAIRRPGIP